jgi:hypothetical protein
MSLRYKSTLDLPPAMRQQAEEQLGLPRAANDPEFKTRKYHNVPVEIDGRKIPSKAQARRHLEIRQGVVSGAILGNLSEISVMLPGGSRMRLDELNNEPVAYPCESCGHHNVIPTLIFEDTKGVITEAWEVKRKLFEASLGVKIRVLKVGRAAND